MRCVLVRRALPGDDGSLPVECPLPVEWLPAEWPTGTTAPTDYWLSTLPETTPSKDPVRLANMRWRIEHDYGDLKTGLGLAHCEGRTYAGWPHHMAFVTVAYFFITPIEADPPTSGWGRLSLDGILERLQRVLTVYLG